MRVRGEKSLREARKSWLSLTCFLRSVAFLPARSPGSFLQFGTGTGECGTTDESLAWVVWLVFGWVWLALDGYG